jgi:ribosome-binding factor A
MDSSPKETKRKQRQAYILRQLSPILVELFSDNKELSSLFVTRVDLSSDRSVCTIFISTFDALPQNNLAFDSIPTENLSPENIQTESSSSKDESQASPESSAARPDAEVLPTSQNSENLEPAKPLTAEERYRQAKKALSLYKPSIRKALSEILHSRYTPYVRFCYDSGHEKSRKIHQLFEQIAQEQRDLEARQNNN